MNILLWTLQILLAIHTLIGAVWKFSNSAEQTMPSLKAIPNGLWLGMAGLEIVISVCLVFPAFYKPLAILVPIAAICIVVEMLVFCGLHLAGGNTDSGPLIYWLVVAALAAFLAYGRIGLKPF